MLMTIQLPDHLVVARAAGIQIRNPPKVTEPGFNSTQMIATPGHLRSGVNRQAKNREVMPPDLFGQAQNFPLEYTAPERSNHFGRGRQREPGDKVRIELELRWTGKSAGVLQLLSEPNYNFAGRAQCSHSTGQAEFGRIMV